MATLIEAGAKLVRRAWRLPLWAHAAVLAVLLLALLPLMSPTSSFTSDEGAYAVQVRALDKGSWAYEYKAAPFDPEGESFPIILSDEGPGDRYYPYIKHPGYPLLLLGTTRVFGEALGLHLPGLLGVLAAAVAAWFLAKELDTRLARPAFWMTVAGPVLVSGYVVWAHAPSAAVAGFALVGAARIARRGVTAGDAVLTVAAVVAGVLLRAEGLLFAAALAPALAVVLFKRKGAARGAAAGALVAVPAVLAVLAERAWIDSIFGGPYSGQGVRQGNGSGSFLGDRAAGAWHELFQAHYVDSTAGPLVLLALVVAVGLGYLALRRWSDRSRLLLAAGVGGAAVLLVLRFVSHPHEAVTGLVTAWPLALLGLLLMRWRGPGATTGLLGLTMALFAAAVLATQYAEGGGLEWGGRFLSPILVPIAVLATAGLTRALDSIPSDTDRSYATALLAAMAAVTAVFALATAGSLRAREDGIVAALERHPATVTVTTRPAYPRIAWRADDRLTWMLTDDARLPALLEHLRLSGVDVNVVVPEDTQVSGEIVDEPALRDDGMKLVAISPK